MSQRMYIPSDYVDEVTPDPRDSASAWISVIDSSPYLAPADDIDDEADVKLMHPGEIVKFDWVEHHGTTTMVVNRDGSFTIEGSVPPDINHVWEYGNDYMGDSVEDFARIFAADYIDGDQATVTVGLARWSTTREHYRLTCIGESWAFVPVGIGSA